VARIGEERKAVGPDAARDLDHGEGERETEYREQSAARAGAVVVRVSVHYAAG
jgi:hypothetical protein